MLLRCTSLPALCLLLCAVFGKVEGTGEKWHGHVTAVTVAPPYRRLRLAEKLMGLLEDVTDTVHRGYFVDLFVRVSNSVAIGMYSKVGGWVAGWLRCWGQSGWQGPPVLQCIEALAQVLLLALSCCSLATRCIGACWDTTAMKRTHLVRSSPVCVAPLAAVAAAATAGVAAAGAAAAIRIPPCLQAHPAAPPCLYNTACGL
jgi:hypothetical protein